MVSKLSMILQGIRDIALIVVSILIMSTSYGQWGIPWANFLFSMVSAFLVFSIINMTLLLKKVTWKGFYYFNTLAQLFTALLLTMLSLLIMLDLWMGPFFLILNAAVLVTLIERRKKQQKPEQPKQA